MTVSVDVYKGDIKLGSGTATSGSASITGFTLASASVPVTSGRNVTLAQTSGTNIGASIATRIITDGGTSLTLQDKWAST